MQKDFTNAETAVKESELWICIGTKQIPVLNAEEQLHVKIFEEESLLVETFDHKKLLRVSEMPNAIMNNLELFAALKNSTPSIQEIIFSWAPDDEEPNEWFDLVEFVTLVDATKPHISYNVMLPLMATWSPSVGRTNQPNQEKEQK